MQPSKLILLNKRIYCVTIICLLSVIFFTMNSRPTNFRPYVEETYEEPVKVTRKPTQPTPKDKDIKYILLWSSTKNTPFNYFGEGRTVFLNKKCAYNNCYVTGDRSYLGDYTEFEVIAFNGPQLNYLRYTNDLPARRHEHQKYVYANIESAETYPICSRVWNEYFNWTWTYRLDSTTVWGYFTIRDRNGTIIGPKKDMHWMKLDEMDPIDNDFKIQLASKARPAAWFASNCNTLGLREDFVKRLQEHLRDFNLEIDIYGDCGTLQCPKSIMSRCLKMIERKYFFYLAFENSISEDYVTEKLLHALNYNAVPVVYGGANYTSTEVDIKKNPPISLNRYKEGQYAEVQPVHPLLVMGGNPIYSISKSRFMPQGIYLDARELGPKKLAETMFHIIHSPEVYYTFFRWKKYYQYTYTHERPDTDVYCKFCQVLNNNQIVTTKFMPKGTFLDARELGPRKLAQLMFHIIHNPEEYYSFFRWKKYYYYQYTHESPESDVYCNFCKVLNNKELLATETVVGFLDQWWTPHHVCKNTIAVRLQ